jgi:hypothetical protein
MNVENAKKGKKREARETFLYNADRESRCIVFTRSNQVLKIRYQY